MQQEEEIIKIKIDKDELTYIYFRFGKDMVEDDRELIEESIVASIFHKKEFAELDIRLLKVLISWWENYTITDEYTNLDRQLYSYYKDKLKTLTESSIINN